MVAVLLAGCKLRYDTVVVIEEDLSGTLGFEISADEELRDAVSGFGDGIDPLAASDALLEQVPEGWEAEQFTEGAFEGARTSTSFANLEELNALVGELNQQAGGAGASTDLLELSASEDGGMITIEGKVGSFFDEIGTQAGGLGVPLDPSLITQGLDLRLLVTMPGEITDDHNGSIDVETGRLEWVFAPGNTDFRAVSDTSSSNGAIIGTVVLVAVVALGLGLWMMQKRRPDEPAPVGESMLAPEEDPYAE